MTLIELQKIFGERINVTLSDSLSAEERQEENEQTKLIVNIGKQMINNGNLIWNYEKTLAQNKNLEKSVIKDLIGAE